MKYDLEERTLNFAKNIVQFCKKLPKNTINNELVSQLVRASCSIGANYIEANESVSKKDFYYRVKICRKESKESNYWLKIISSTNPEFEKEIITFLQETSEFVKIFSSIISKNP